MRDKISIDRINLLHPKIQKEVLYLINRSELVIDPTLAIRVVQGLRTIEEQDALYAQGRTAPGNIVTKAKGGASFHNYGLAIDICFLFEQPDGTFKYDDEKSWLNGPNFMKVVKIFKDAGYTWGGDFKSITDKPHFEKIFGYTWQQLFDKYNKKDFIPGTEYVNI